MRRPGAPEESADTCLASAGQALRKPERPCSTEASPTAPGAFVLCSSAHPSLSQLSREVLPTPGLCSTVTGHPEACFQAQRAAQSHAPHSHRPPTPSSHQASLAQGDPLLVHPPRTKPGRPGVSPSARHQVRHRQDLHSSGPRVTPKMKAQLQERGHEVNANGVCFRAGRTGAGKDLPVIQSVAGKAGVQTGLRLPKFATPSPGIAGTPVVSGTRRGETGIAPQDRECEVCISEFSENFPSSAQGRNEYRLRAWGARKRGFLRAGIRAGQIPENTGFFAGCLAPLGGGPLTFSTPRAQGLGPCPTGSPCREHKFWGQLGWMGQGSGPHEGLPARRSKLRTAASRNPTAQQRRPPHHKPTGSPRPGCLHLCAALGPLGN